jgi:hypothetical protein
MTKTGLEFGILVIVICLIFDICDLEFLSLHYFKAELEGGLYEAAPYIFLLFPGFFYPSDSGRLDH